MTCVIQKLTNKPGIELVRDRLIIWVVVSGYMTLVAFGMLRALPHGYMTLVAFGMLRALSIHRTAKSERSNFT
jgi:hypothetical protein